MIVIEAALWIHSAPASIVGTVFAEAAVGTLFRHGLGFTDAPCDSGNRAKLSAALFLHSGPVGPVLLLASSIRPPGPGFRAPRPWA